MEKTDEVKVVGHWCSPFALRPFIALNIKSIKYQVLEEQIGCKSDLLLKVNPVLKKIPVLLHNDKTICESLMIVEYIDEVWSNSPAILPSDPYNRAQARFWAQFIDDKLYEPIRELRTSMDAETKRECRERVMEAVGELEGAYVKCSEGKSFFGGDRIGYLDIAFGCFLGWIKVVEKLDDIKVIDEVKSPGLFKWAKVFCEDDAVSDVMPSTDKLIEVSEIIAGLRAAGKAPVR